MAVAAVPGYLGKDFSQASPGLRFGMYLPLWGVNSRSGELLWTTSDVRYEARGPQREERALPTQNKTAALRDATRLTAADRALMAALAQRQDAIAAPLADQGRLLTVHAQAVAPFSTGLGNEHPLENGFAFLNPYGLPYLAGSGVKGVLRQAARELAEHRWGEDQGWTEDAITALFGKTTSDGETEHQRGALMFWDVIPQIKDDALQVEVMTPHQSHYLQNGDSPHESGQPNPINFLTVPPGSKFVFHVQCDVPFLARLAPELTRDNRWQLLLGAALAHAFQWLGFGAKTAVGYGAMREDLARSRQLAEERAAACLLAERQRKRAAKSANFCAIDDFAEDLNRRSEELKGGKDKANTALHQRAQQLVRNALEGADSNWSASERAALADTIEAGLPKVVNLPDVKDAMKKLKLRALRGQT